MEETKYIPQLTNFVEFADTQMHNPLFMGCNYENIVGLKLLSIVQPLKIIYPLTVSARCTVGGLAKARDLE